MSRSLLALALVAVVIGGGAWWLFQEMGYDGPDVDAKGAEDPARENATLMTSAGGMLRASGTDPASGTLTIPEGALASEENLTMVPLATVDGLPANVTDVVAYDFGPDGLAFAKPVILTIPLPDGVTADDIVVFGFNDSARYPLAWSEAEGVVAIEMEHFSGAGFGIGPCSHVVFSRPEHFDAAENATWVDVSRISCDSRGADKAAMDARIREHLDTHVKGVHDVILTDDVGTLADLVAALNDVSLIATTWMREGPLMEALERELLAYAVEKTQEALPLIERRCSDEDVDLATATDTLRGMMGAVGFLTDAAQDEAGDLPPRLHACATKLVPRMFGLHEAPCGATTDVAIIREHVRALMRLYVDAISLGLQPGEGGVPHTPQDAVAHCVVVRVHPPVGRIGWEGDRFEMTVRGEFTNVAGQRISTEDMRFEVEVVNATPDAALLVGDTLGVARTNLTVHTSKVLQVDVAVTGRYTISAGLDAVGTADQAFTVPVSVERDFVALVDSQANPQDEAGDHTNPGVGDVILYRWTFSRISGDGPIPLAGEDVVLRVSGGFRLVGAPDGTLDDNGQVEMVVERVSPWGTRSFTTADLVDHPAIGGRGGIYNVDIYPNEFEGEYPQCNGGGTVLPGRLIIRVGEEGYHTMSEEREQVTVLFQEEPQPFGYYPRYSREYVYAGEHIGTRIDATLIGKNDGYGHHQEYDGSPRTVSVTFTESRVEGTIQHEGGCSLAISWSAT